MPAVPNNRLGLVVPSERHLLGFFMLSPALQCCRGRGHILAAHTKSAVGMAAA